MDTRSDVYSLGAVLYELLTGSTPLDHIESDSYVEVLRRIRNEPIKPPSARLLRSGDKNEIAELRQTERAKLPKVMQGELDWITMKALEKDRARRYETVNGLARDLRRYLEGEPCGSCPAVCCVPGRQVRPQIQSVACNSSGFRGAPYCWHYN